MSRGIRRKQQKDFEATLVSLGFSPVERLVAIATDNVPCSTCKGTKRTHYKLTKDMHHPTCKQPGNDEDGICLDCRNLGRRICMSCKATGMDSVPPAVQANVALKMLDKLVPDLRSIEVKGEIELQAVQVFERLARGRERLIVDGEAKQITQ